MIGDALRVIRQHPWLLILYPIVTAVLIGMVVGWFWIPDSTTAAVALSGLGVITILVCGSVWIGGTLLFFRDAHRYGEASFVQSLARAFKHLPALLIWALLLCATIYMPGAKQMGLRLTWLIAPAIFLPLGASVAGEGFAGFDIRKWKIKSFFFFMVFVAIGLGLPALLWIWHPELPGLTAQLVSFGIRAGLAYFILITAWLITASLMGRESAGAPVEANPGPPNDHAAQPAS